MELAYIGFIALVVGLLALDLGVFHRKAHAVSVREALGWSAVWISLGVAFGGVIWATMGGTAAVQYLTGFVVEKSLAVDNIFVITTIFASFAVPAAYQHRVLFWGILGALVMRGALIALGATLIAEAAWIMYVFGAFLVATGIKLAVAREKPEADVKNHGLVRFVKRFVRVHDGYDGARMFVRGAATPLFLALVLVEATDLIFAVDSIPAIFAITDDPFLVFTSNVFALLGMRSLYFALAGMVDRFRYLKPALAAILVLVGTKMLAHGWLHDLVGAALPLLTVGAIAAILGVAVLASLRHARSNTRISPVTIPSS